MIRLTIISSIAQHKNGLDLHLANISWAAAGLNSQLFILTFEEYKFSRRGVNFVNFQGNSRVFTNFWDSIEPLLRARLEETDVFLFTEQDIFFTEPIEEQVNRCAQSKAIIFNLESSYLSTFSKNKALIQPRVWEGATFIPASFIRDALDDGISFGQGKKWLVKNNNLNKNFFSELYTSDSKMELSFLAMQDLIEKRSIFDTLFEFSAYCSLKCYPWISYGLLNIGYEMGQKVVHFWGLDRYIHDYPELYNDAAMIFKIESSLFKIRLNEVGYMLYLTGTNNDKKILPKILFDQPWSRKVDLLIEKVKRLSDFASVWMSNEQYERFCWAENILRSQTLRLM